MKSYIYSLGNLTNHSNNYSDYTQSLIDNALASVPYWNKPKTTSTFSLIGGLASSKRSPLFDSSFNKNLSVNNLYDLWAEALNKVDSYRYKVNKPSYEATICGIPTNFFSDFIQIGDTILPTYASKNYINNLPIETKQTIYNISVNINKYYLSA